MNKRSVIGVFCCAMLLSSSAWAVTVEPGQGTLSINQGQGFQPIDSRIDTNVGDSVMIAPGGSATVVYDDGCTVDVQPGAVTTIAALSPCAAGSYDADMVVKAPPLAGAAGAPAAAPPSPFAVDPGTVVVGVGLAAVVGFIVYEAISP